MNGTMIDFALLADLAKQTKPETQMMTRINVLEFFGNGSIVHTAGLKRQAGEAPSTKLQAPSTRSVRQIVARQFVLLTEATSTKPQAPSAKLQAS